MANVPCSAVAKVMASPSGEMAKLDSIAAFPGKVRRCKCRGTMASLNSPLLFTNRHSPLASRVVKRVKSTTPCPFGRVSTLRADTFSILAKSRGVVSGNTANTEASAAATRAEPKLVPEPTPGVTNGTHAHALETASQPDDRG